MSSTTQPPNNGLASPEPFDFDSQYLDLPSDFGSLANERWPVNDSTSTNQIAHWDPAGSNLPAPVDPVPSSADTLSVPQDWPSLEELGLDNLNFMAPDMTLHPIEQATDVNTGTPLPIDDASVAQTNPLNQQLEGLPQLGDDHVMWDDTFDSDFFENNLASISAFNEFGFQGWKELSPANQDEVSSDATTIVAPSQGSSVPPPGSLVPSYHAQQQFTTDDEKWEATRNRLRAADRCFLYGVTTTKVFCRPSCASRRAGRQYIQYFPFPNAIEAATKAGFRPCKRCNPDTIDVVDKGVHGVVRALRMIICDAFEPRGVRDREAPLKLEDLAKEADLSPFHFQRVFKAITQVTPGDFSTASQSLAIQDALARQLPIPAEQGIATMSMDNMDVNEIMQQYSRWNVRTAKKALGNVSPQDYAIGMPKINVKYVGIDSPAGKAYIAYSGKTSIHAVLVGEDAETRLHSRFVLPDKSLAPHRTLMQSIANLRQETKDRDTELPEDVLQSLWRTRIWLKLVRDAVLDDVEA